MNYDYLYNKEYYGDTLNAEHYRDENLHWRIIPRGAVLPHLDLDGAVCGGILDEEGEYIDGSGIHRGMGAGYGTSSMEISEADEDVVFLGLWPMIWGHCITDNIRRLWVLNNSDFIKKYGHLRFVYLPMYDIRPDQNFNSILSILGADTVKLEPINTVTRFRNLILPDESFWREDDGTRVYTSEYVEMVDKIRDYGKGHCTASDVKKVYFSYRRTPSYRVIGERRLERFFRKNGYTIIYPERLTLTEQLNALQNCEEFASTAGSLSHNIVFLRDGAKVFLIPRAGFITEYQLALDTIHDLDITYVDASLSLYVRPQRQWDGPFYYLISRQLQDCFGRSIRRYRVGADFWIYKYLGYAMNGISKPLDYYEKAIEEYLPADPEWDGRDNLAVRLCRKQRFRKIIAKLFA